MKLYTTNEVALLTGLSRAHLSEKCKRLNMQKDKRRYKLSIQDWEKLINKKHHNNLYRKHADVEIIPIFDGICYVNETYYIFESKMNSSQ